MSIFPWNQGSGAGGSGTANRISKWINSSTLGDSLISEDGNYIKLDADKYISGEDTSKWVISLGTTTNPNIFFIGGDGDDLSESLIWGDGNELYVSGKTNTQLGGGGDGSTQAQGYMSITSANGILISITDPTRNLTIVGLPTSSAGLAAGDIWLNSNVLTIVP